MHTKFMGSDAFTSKWTFLQHSNKQETITNVTSTKSNVNDVTKYNKRKNTAIAG